MSSTTISSAIILVADAAPLLRCGFRYTLTATFATYQVLEAASFSELLALISEQSPALIILSPDLPGAPVEPVALLATLRSSQPPVPVMILVDPLVTPELTVLRLLRQNVNSLLLRTTPLSEICESVATVLQRGRCYGDYALTLLQGHLQQDPKSQKTAILSPRQLQILHLVAKDLANEEIAEHLCTSVRTVEYHRSQMLQKTGVRTTLGLVLFAIRHNLLSDSILLPSNSQHPLATAGRITS